MEEETLSPDFLWLLFRDLRQRKFPLGISDYEDLRTLLQLGFGWESDEAFLQLCCTLWAKSSRDIEIIRALATQYIVPKWELGEHETVSPSESRQVEPEVQQEVSQPPQPSSAPSDMTLTTVTKDRGWPPKPQLSDDLSHLTLIPRFPLSYREVAQAWRRIRKPLRFGPRVEIDLDATLERAVRVGRLAGPVLIPARRNTSRLLLLVDSLGSMNPFRLFVREVVEAITSASAFGRVGVFYFHDVMTEGSSASAALSADELFPSIDPILESILPLARGHLYSDEALLQPLRIIDVYETYAVGADTVILSDAGAARSSFDYQRLVDTVACIKYLRSFSHRIVWLNPLPKKRWKATTAGAIARHVPMFPLNASGVNQAVVTLKSERFVVDRPF